MPDNETETKGQGATEIDEILAEGTPPNHWAEDYIEYRFSGRTSDCGLRLSLPTVTVPTPTIGDIQGLDQARQDMTEISNMVDSLIHVIRGELPRSIDRTLDWLLGPTNPNPPGALPPMHFSPFPGIPLPFNPFNLQYRVSALVGNILQKLYQFPPTFTPTTPTTPNPLFSPQDGIINIGTQENQEIGVNIFSQMTSTYSFGRGQGTSHGTPPGSPITAAVNTGTDLPWFGKALLLKSQTELPTGQPRPMRETSRYWIAQLGHAGEQITIHTFGAKLETISHGMRISVRFNGNYGKVRVILIPREPCKVVWGDFKVEGPYESDIVALEEARFSRVETAREQILQTMTSVQNLLVMIGIAATAIPVFGAVINLLLRRIVLLLEEKKNTFRNSLDSVNRIQRRRNLNLAEIYPERGPVGGAEDNPR